jgi:hypothetical protein
VYAFINSRLGALLAFPIVLLCSLFLSITFADAVSAVDGTWTDNRTITVNSKAYTGPTAGFLNNGGSPNVASNWQVFTPAAASDKSRLYFPTNADFNTVRSGSYTGTGFTNDGQTLNLTNTRATAGTVPTPPTTDPDAEQTAQDTCAIDGVGWLICPLAAFFAKVNDGAYVVVQQLLIFEIPNAFSTNPTENPIYGVWSTLRNLANILFVIAFFAVIFSQATSVGISAYGIRKMLPRIIVSAILVNLSYYLCIFAIDISNIIGAGFTGLIQAAAPAAIGAAADNNPWEEAGSAILAFQVAGAAAAGAAAIAVFFTGFFFALAVTAFLAIFFTLVILMVRHALLILLIILSPLAFVAYILPNTESIFDKWRKTFISLLVMYPLIALLFAGTKLASDILISTHQGDGSVGGWIDTLYLLMALGVLTIPLFGIPWIVKFSGGALARFAGVMNNKSKGLVDRARKAGDEGAKVRRGNLRADAASGRFGSRPTSGFETDEKGNLKLDKDGKAIKKQGTRARLARARGLASVGGAAQAAGRYSGDKKWERENQMREAEKKILDDRIERLNETGEVEEVSADGMIIKKQVATSGAQQLATRAAGVGGAEGAARIQRLAREQQKKEILEDTGRHMSDLQKKEYLSSGAYYFEQNAETGKWEGYSDHGRAMTAIAKGARMGAVKAGEERTVENALKNEVDTRGWENDATKMGITQAAMKRQWDIGDAAGIGYSLYGDESQGIKRLSDKQIGDYMGWADPKVAAKLSHLITNDNGLNGVSGEALKDWHGWEFKVAGSRVVQLRQEAADLAASGDTAEAAKRISSADKIQSAVEVAYQKLSTDPNMVKDFKQKHVTAMGDFNAIVSGKKDRLILREYGDRSTTVAADGTELSLPNITAEGLVKSSGTAATKDAKLMFPVLKNLSTPTVEAEVTVPVKYTSVLKNSFSANDLGSMSNQGIQTLMSNAPINKIPTEELTIISAATGTNSGVPMDDARRNINVSVTEEIQKRASQNSAESTYSGNITATQQRQAADSAYQTYVDNGNVAGVAPLTQVNDRDALGKIVPAPEPPKNDTNDSGDGTQR